MLILPACCTQFFSTGLKQPLQDAVGGAAVRVK
jgi:hypothetical protein